MRPARFRNRFAALLPLLAVPVRALAQTAGVDSSNTTPASSNWGASVAILAVVLVMLLAIGIAVKLYDLKRKREDEAVSLQSHISDALLLDRSLAGLVITALASGSLWRHSPVVIAIAGTVPTPELRDTVMRLVEQELSRRYPGARAEDRLVVDPLIGKQRAGTFSR